MRRREFIGTSTGAAAAAAAPYAWPARSRLLSSQVESSSGDPATLTTLRDSRVRALALSAAEAARSAGARYADVRLTNTIDRWHDDEGLQRGTVKLGLSVRALVNGYWGWAATPTLSTDEAVRVARLATKFATLTASRGTPNAVELGTIPVVQNGEWMTPVKIDPFTLDPLELQQWLYGVRMHVYDLGIARGAPASIAWAKRRDARQIKGFSVGFQKQERVFASTEGALYTQTVITTVPGFMVEYHNAPAGQPLTIPNFTNVSVQAGWERIVETPIIELFQREMDRADATPPLAPAKHAEVGRYDIVLSAQDMGVLLNRTFGPATQIDRALGYEANAGGTSYLGPDPFTVLGTTVASPLVTVTAERSDPLGVATVKWDDDGVTPEDFTLIKNGVLKDYQTTREQAAWLAPWYEKQGTPVRSHGCAMAPSAMEVPMQHVPNITLHPGTGTATEESLVRDLEHGLHITPYFGFQPQSDWQGRNNYAVMGGAVEIRRGKPVATFGYMALMFSTEEIWKNIQALGGVGSAVSVTGSGTESAKGDPVQNTLHSVRAVPARIKQVAVVDPTKKA